MKKIFNQKGSSHIVLIALLLVLAGVGFAAYRVYQSSQDKKADTNTTTQQTEEVVSDDTKDTVSNAEDLTKIEQDLEALDLDKELDTSALEEDLSQIQ